MAELGWAQPQQAVRGLQEHLALHAVEPLAAVRALTRHARLLCLGERHDVAGRVLLAELVKAAAEGGAKWLFVEVDADEQPQLDDFMCSGHVADLPTSAGGGRAAVMPFQQPFVDALLVAQQMGMRIVAMDAPEAELDERNHVMALTVEQHLQQASGCGVVIVGQLHLVPRPILGCQASMAALLRDSLDGAVVTVGRAVPDPWPAFSVWADVAAVQAPCLLRTAGSPFAYLASNWGSPALLGSDFDHLLFYPAPVARLEHVGLEAVA